MMNKIASDAYSQGAYEVLAQLNLPGHIKQAAAAHLVKESGAVVDALGKAKTFLSGGSFNPLTLTKGRRLKALQDAGLNTGSDRLTRAALSRLRQDQARAALAVTGTGLGVAGLSGAFDGDDDFLSRAQEGDLSNSEIAALAGGTAALGAGGAYAAGLL